MNFFSLIFDNFSSRDRGLAFIFLVFSGIMFYFWINYQPKITKRNLESIAVLDSMAQDVRWKLTGSFDWVKPAQKEGLVSGDQIFTGDMSRASIRYKDKNIKITLLPNSLVTIEEIDAKLAMSIVSGAIEVNGEESGSILVKDKDIVKEITIEKDKVIQLEKNDIVVEKKATIFPKIITPNHGEVFDLEQSFKIGLDHSFSGKVQLSRTSDFKNVTNELSLDGTNSDSIKLIEEGDYFLRLIKDNAKSRTRFFKVKSGYNVNLLSPTSNQVIKLRRDEPLNIQIEANKYSNLELVLFKNELQMEKIPFSSASKSINLRYGGKLSYEIRATKNNKTIYKTNRVPFDVYFDALSFKKDPERIIDSGKIIEFTIKKNANERIHYSLAELARNKEAKVLLIKGTVNEKIDLKKLTLGNYRLTVNSDSFPAQEDLQHEFFVADKVGKIKNIISYGNEKINESDKVKILDWGEELRVKLTDLKLSERDLMSEVKNGGKLIPSQFSANSTLVFNPLNPGEYCVELKAQPEFDQNVYVPISKCFIFEQKNPFPKIDKAQDQVLEVSVKDEGETYTIVSPKYEDVAKYNFFIYSDKNATKLVFEGSAKTNKFNWISNRSGIYYFRYQLTDSKGRKSEMSPISRIVFPISPLSEW